VSSLRRFYTRTGSTCFSHVQSYLFAENMEPALERVFCLDLFRQYNRSSLLSLYLHRHHEYFSLGASVAFVESSFHRYSYSRQPDLFLFRAVGIQAALCILSWSPSFMAGGQNERTSDTTPIWAGRWSGAHNHGLVSGNCPGDPRLYATVMVLSLGMFVYYWKIRWTCLTSFSVPESKPKSEPRQPVQPGRS